MGIKQAFLAFFRALKKEQLPSTVSESPHLDLLKLLQQEGRLIDFLKEDITSYSDAQVGAAVRKIHAECAKTLELRLSIRPIFKEEENSSVIISLGYDPKEVKVIGNVKGIPPYKGKLLHKGWRAHRGNEVIYPAQVEV
ncbi:MAG: DUF2760 domain-containing protein [Chlamydiia bacterium]|nr:DUF2760 domain-containing protein [Chlamydiia bacterium]